MTAGCGYKMRLETVMKHSLVIQIARFGDLVQTKRLMTSLLQSGGGEVHLLVDNSLKSLAQIIYPEAVVHSIAAHGTGLSGAEAVRTMLVDNRRVFEHLRSIGFDAVYNLNFSPLNYRIAALFDADCVHGHRWIDGQEKPSEWAAMAMRWTGNRRLGINIVDFWGAYAQPLCLPDAVNPDASPKGGGVGIVLAGRESRRSLPAEYIARIAGVFAAKYRGPVSLLGSGAEAAAGENVLDRMPSALRERTVNLAGKTGWGELCEVVSSLDMLMTPDTGTMHLAAHFGVPVHAFFLSSAWCFETGPYGRGHTVYQAVQDCLPCLEVAECHHAVKCLSPFGDPAFVRTLATGKYELLPEGLTVFETAFDALGLTFEAAGGSDAEAQSRNDFRAFLAAHLGLSDTCAGAGQALWANKLYRDKQWIFEQ